ncbi:MAG: bacterial Ig-like domain-containing protein [Clostridia bacterium]|nr:bacterial Ig-like domain-containing protein [Clostridia bacterium]
MNKRRLKVLVAVLLAAAAIFTVSFSVAAAENDKKVVSFSVSAKDGAKDEYHEGDIFDPTGYEGLITYKDGTTDTVASSQLIFSPSTPLKSTDRQITFSCNQTQISSGLPITVHALESIAVKSQPSKTKYYAGDIFNPDGLELQLHFADGKDTAVAFSDCSVSPSLIDPLSSAVSEITVSYDLAGHTVKTEIPLKVIGISSLRVSGTPAASFYEGAAFTSAEGLCVIAEFSDGTKNEFYTEYTIPDANKPLIPGADGNASLTVCADGKTAEFKVPVISVKSFTVKCPDNKKNVYPGNKFDKSIFTVNAVFSDKSEIDITDRVDFSQCPDIITAGIDCKAFYIGHEITLPLTVHSGTIDIISQPDKVSYSAGETFDPKGMLVAVIFDDSTRKTLSASEYTVDVSSPLTEAVSFATVRYAGLEAKVSINVISDNPIKKIEIYHAPDHIKYIAGQTFSTDGLIVVAYYTNSELPQILSIDSLIFYPSLETPLSASDTSVEITLQISDSLKFSTEQPIEVESKIPSQIFVTRSADKTEYKEGEKFDPTGLEVSLYYNDGTTIPLTAGFTISPSDPFVLTSGQKETVTVTIEFPSAELRCFQFVNVTPVTVKDISVAIQPDKMEYYVGERFDPTGMKLILTYADPSIAPVIVPDGEYTVSPAGALTETDTFVQVSFRGVSVNLNITLNGGVIPPVTSEPTTIPDSDTSVPPETSPDSMTVPPEITTEPSESTTSVVPHTTPVNSDGSNPMLFLWIVIIAVIIIALVALIIFYKRNFT